MALRFTRPLGNRPFNTPGLKVGGSMTPLQKITQQYRQQQQQQTVATQQTITQLAQTKQKITAAATAATQNNQTPLNTYLQRSGEMVERRMSALQAKINGQQKPNE